LIAELAFTTQAAVDAVTAGGVRPPALPTSSSTIVGPGEWGSCFPRCSCQLHACPETGRIHGCFAILSGRHAVNTCRFRRTTVSRPPHISCRWVAKRSAPGLPVTCGSSKSAGRQLTSLVNEFSQPEPVSRLNALVGCRMRDRRMSWALAGRPFAVNSLTQQANRALCRGVLEVRTTAR